MDVDVEKPSVPCCGVCSVREEPSEEIGDEDEEEEEEEEDEEDLRPVKASQKDIVSWRKVVSRVSYEAVHAVEKVSKI